MLRTSGMEGGRGGVGCVVGFELDVVKLDVAELDVVELDVVELDVVEADVVDAVGAGSVVVAWEAFSGFGVVVGSALFASLFVVCPARACEVSFASSPCSGGSSLYRRCSTVATASDKIVAELTEIMKA